MNDIMLLLYKNMTDIKTFKEEDYTIFSQTEREELKKKKIHNDIFKHWHELTTNQKYILINWALNNTQYSIDELITSLQKFIDFLKMEKRKEKINSNICKCFLQCWKSY
jgi:hypothetical protein